ncbi:MAG: histidine--tRNA ligase [Candidatus Nomurabacteria bacterium]|jgi:histidyl-tRNA synthetase|nr:histidine--tRNA ligase [Candidatus Nomurabacteria bacterium]
MSLSLQSYKGTRDIYPEDMRLRNYIFNTWRTVAESFGYEEYDAPLLESLEIYAAKSGQEIVNDQTYTFTDRGDRTVAIRPEMTPSISRMVAARRQEMPMPARLFSISNFMRYERPQKGREREFWQFNMDLFGVDGVAADAEIITMSDKIMRKLGADEAMFKIRVNDRRLTDFVMRKYLELDENQAGAMIKLFDRREKISVEEFETEVAEIVANSQSQLDSACHSELVSESSKESAEILKRVQDDNIGIQYDKNDIKDSKNIIKKINKIIEAKSLDEFIKNMPENAPIDELKELFEKLEKSGISSAVFDPTLMRGFDYYTGTVFEVFDQNPDNRRAMFGGGRYDGLISLFGVEPLPVVGAGIGETTTIEFLRGHDLIPELKPATDVMIIPMGDIDVTDVANNLREQKFNVAIDFTDRKTDKKIKAAAKANIQFVAFIGETEIESGEIILKNLTTGEQQPLSILISQKTK